MGLSPSRRKKKKLTYKRRRFVELYCGEARFNGKLAAEMAGYSPNGAAACASELLSIPEVQEYLKEFTDKQAMQSGEIMVRLSEMGRGELTPFQRITADGDVVVDLSTAEAQANFHLIKKIEIVTTRTPVPGLDPEGKPYPDRVQTEAKIELHDAKDALKALAQIRGLFKLKLTGDPEEPVEVNVTESDSARKRLLRRVAGIASRVGEAAGTGGVPGPEKGTNGTGTRGA